MIPVVLRLFVQPIDYVCGCRTENGLTGLSPDMYKMQNRFECKEEGRMVDFSLEGRHAQPGEMAGAVLYLVSDAASFTTGTCIACDGGFLA